MMVVLSLLLAQPLGLQQALARARAANPELAAARQSVRVGEAVVEGAGQLINPTFIASHGPDDPVNSATLDVRAPIFGQRGTAIEAAEREVDVQRAAQRALELRVLALVRRAYFALAAAQVRAGLAEGALSLAREFETRIEAKVSSGSAPQLDLLQARLARRRAEQERDDRLAALLTAREELGRLIGERDNAQLEAADPLLPVPEPPTLDQLAGAAGQHPEVQSRLRERDAALARADRERAAVRPIPDFALTLEDLRARTSIGLRAGIAFDLPLLSWNRGRVHEQQAQAELSSIQARGALERLRSEVRAAWARWHAAAARARSYAGDIVPASERLERMAREAYELGRAPLLTVLQARADLNSAHALATDAAERAQRALADLEEASGGF